MMEDALVQMLSAIKDRRSAHEVEALRIVAARTM
jgi:hypothetical protein